MFNKKKENRVNLVYAAPAPPVQPSVTPGPDRLKENDPTMITVYASPEFFNRKPNPKPVPPRAPWISPGSDLDDEEQTVKVCPNCGSANVMRAKYCCKCGKPFVKPKKWCRNCGSVNLAGWKFCIECGQPLDEAPDAQSGRKPDPKPQPYPKKYEMADDPTVVLPAEEETGKEPPVKALYAAPRFDA